MLLFLHYDDASSKLKKKFLVHSLNAEKVKPVYLESLGSKKKKSENRQRKFLYTIHKIKNLKHF